MEIEKKYLLSELPDNLQTYRSVSIEQAYIMVTENEELRIRKKDHSFVLTFKRGSGTTRDEIEIEISREQYEEFERCAVGTPIRKKRILYPHHEHTIEIDIYKSSLEGLIVAEVEFSSPRDMERFSPPDWFAEDVSRKGEFKNKNLAMQGFPASLLHTWKETSRPPWHFRQSGVVPFRRADAGYEVLLITTRRSGKWIVPKGIIEPDLSPAESAEKEALEEAGVAGTILQDIQEPYSYDKWNGRCEVKLFPLQVTEEHAHWPEETDRKREWVAQGDIDDFLESGELRNAVAAILRRLGTCFGDS